jgi:hypothetical protein
MKVVKTITNGLPAHHRELPHRARLHRSPLPPSGQNLKFRELFSAAPLARRLANAQSVIKEPFNKLTK